MSRQNSNAEANKPVHTVRHRNLKASIWCNQTDKGSMYNVTFTRSYRDGDSWHDSNSFSYDDLMNVAKLMYDAHSVITAIRARESVGRQESGPAEPQPPRQLARREPSNKKGANQ